MAQSHFDNQGVEIIIRELNTHRQDRIQYEIFVEDHLRELLDLAKQRQVPTESKEGQTNFHNKMIESGLMKVEYEEVEFLTQNFSQSLIIGSGGCGSVYYVSHPSGSEVAVKRIGLSENEFGEDGDKKHLTPKEQFENGAIMLAYCRHLGIVNIIGYSTSDDGSWGCLLLEFMKGGSLDKRLRNTTHLTWDKRLKIACRIAEAFKYLHSKGILHRDVKSANIGMDENDNPKLLDFDMAKLSSNCNVPEILKSRYSRSGIVGTLPYMDPNYIENSIEGYKESHEIYSLGIVYLELITGKIAGQGLMAREWKQQYDSKALNLAEISDPSANWPGDVLCEFSQLAFNCIGVTERPSAVDLHRTLSRLIQIYFVLISPRSNCSSNITGKFKYM